MIATLRNHSSALLSAVLIATLSSSSWAANSLVFTTPPTNTVAGASISTIVVTVKDGANTVTTFNGPITLAIASNPSSGTLSGLLTVNALNGVANFANLSINKAGTGYTLSASATGIASVNSAAFNITPGAASQLSFTAQPTDTLSNAAISPAVKVSIVDDFGNVVTTASTTITLTLEANPGSATLGGVTSLTTTSGEAVFNNVSIGVIGADYSLRATGVLYGFTVSDPFDIAHNLEFTVQPSDTVAGVNISPAVKVTIKDGLGNVVSPPDIQVKLTLKTNPGSATLSGTSTVLAVNGVAEFSGLNLNKAANGYSLQAVATSTFGAVSNTFNVSPGPASKLVYAVQPVTTLIGTTIPDISVTVKDAFDNTVTSATNLITLTIRTNPSNGALSGTTSVNAVNGVAVFTGLSIDKAGNGYTLAATSPGLLEKVSSAFNITYKLVFITQPSDVAAGVAIAPEFSVAIQDALGNTITTATGEITIGVFSGPTGGATSGTIKVAAVNGVAVFSNVILNKVGTYVLKATSPSIAQGTSASIVVSPGAAAKLAFTAQPTSNTVAAAKHTTVIKVEVRDIFDNPVPTATNAVTLALDQTTVGTLNPTLSGTLTVNAIDGVATFDNIFIDLPKIGYKLIATSGMLEATSSAFNIKYLLAFVQQPQDNPTCNGLVSCSVAVTNVNGVTLTQINDVVVTLSFSVNPTGTKMNFETFINVSSVTATTANGIATFNNIFVYIGGDNYRFRATGTNQSGTAVSNEFDLVGCAYSLKFTQQPTSTLVNLPFNPPVKVSVVGLDNKVVTTASGTMLLLLKGGDPNALFTGTVSNVASAPIVAGVATFDNLAVDRPGTDYILEAYDNFNQGSDSAKFTIRYKLAFTTQPTDTVAGQIIQPALPATTINVTVLDGLNAQPSPPVTPNITMAPGAGSFTLLGTTSRPIVGGVAAFDNLSITKSGVNYKLKASATGLYVAATSDAFDILTDSPTKLFFRAQPKTAFVNAVLSPAVKVEVQDQYNNVVTSPSFSITLAISTNPGSATLSGTTTIPTVNGTATFSNLSLNRAGVGYKLTASAATLTDAVSAVFDIKYNITFVVQPSNTISMQSITPGVQVSLEDAFGVPQFLATDTVVMSIASGSPAGTLSGTLSVAAVNGIATFNDLSINKSGVAFKLSAKVTTIGTANSAAFDITPGAPAKLAFKTTPGTTVAGLSLTAPPGVEVHDSQGNVVSTANNAITLSIDPSSTVPDAVLNGTTTVSAANGLAVFNGLSITKASTGYKLHAVADGLTPITSGAFTISASSPVKLGFAVQPADALVGANFATTVAIQDTYGNTCALINQTIVLSLEPNAFGGVLSGTTTRNTASTGLAAFSALSIGQIGTGYILKATSVTFGTVLSAPFNVTYKLAFSTQPTATVAGQTMSSFTVEVQNGAGALVTTQTGNVTITLSTGSAAGTLTRPLVDGVATFNDISINIAGSYTFTASSAGLISSNPSSAFVISAGSAFKLAFTVQPTDSISKEVISPFVAVTVQDQFGNKVTSPNHSITLGFGNNPGGGSLSGATKNTVSGVATFNTLSVQNAGAGYTLVATANTLASATSDPFNITYKLRFVNTLVNTVAGSSIAGVEVRIAHNDNTDVGTGTDNITIGMGNNPTGTTLFGTLSAAAVNGAATFSDLSIQKVGTNYNLTASAAGINNGTSASFNITPAAPDRLAFSVQPGNAIVNASLAPAVQVRVLDEFDNHVTTATDSVSLAFGTNSTSANLTGTVTVNAVAGTATFSTLAVDKAGNGFTLAATSGTLTGATSDAFNIRYQLVFTVQPTHTGAGLSINPAVQVSIQDALGTTVSTASDSITLALGNNPAGALLTGTLTRNAVNGVATFSGLNLDKTGLSFTLVATASGIASATSFPFNNTNLLIFTDQPTNVITNAVISPSVKVAVRDGLGNTITAATGSITIAIESNPGGGTLGGTLSAALVNGVATFNNLTVNAAGNGYTLSATAIGIANGTSATFNVRNRLLFTAQPTQTAADSEISPAVAVSVVDAVGAVITSANDTITLAIGANPGSSTLSGNTSIDAVNGVALFSDLNLNKTGTGYTLVASASGLTNVTSSLFNIVPGAAVSLAFVAQPTNTTAGVVITPAVTAELLDVKGNRVTTDTRTIDIDLSANPGGDTLGGTLSVNAVAGLATFNNLVLTRAATGYSLIATTSGVTSATSNLFNVATAAASKLVVTSEPTDALAGAVIAPAITVTVTDNFNNTISSTIPIAVVIETNPGSGTLSGTASVNTVAGVATFSNLSINKSGTGYVLGFTSNGLAGAFSDSFDISPNAPNRVVLRSQPTDAVTNAIITPEIIAAIEDNFGNTVDTYSGDISITLGNNTTSATLLGNTTLAVANGLATFNDLSVNRAGVAYTLIASSGALTTDTSDSFTVVNRLAFSVNPSNTGAGQAISPAVQVTVVDANGNIMTTATNTITLQFDNNPVSATLNGTLSTAAINGVASFSNLSITKAAQDFSLRATATGLQAAVSTAFDIIPAAPDHIAFTVQPIGTSAGSILSPSVSVGVYDQYNNLTTNVSPNVTLALSPNPGSTTLLGTLTQATQNGVAVFDNLHIDVAANGYGLSATSGALPAVGSNTFNIVAAAPSKLVFGVQPQNSAAGATLTPALTVSVRDAFDNLVSSATNTVTMTVSGGANLAGTASINAASGVATFSTLNVTTAGTGFTLTAASNGLQSATSSPFDITAGPPSQIGFTVQPSDTEPGAVITPAVLVGLQDAFGNVITASLGDVTLSLNGAAVLNGVLTKSLANGVATFNDLSIGTAGTGFSLVAAYTGLPSVTSASFSIVDQTPPQISSGVTPSSGSMNAGANIVFTVGATDTQTLTYVWDFGDGTSTTTQSSSVEHTYVGPGSYVVTVTITDASGLSTKSVVNVSIAAAVSPDDICNGLNPVPLVVQKFGVKLSFSKPLKDSVALTAAIDLKDGFSAAGQQVRWNIAGVLGEVTLDPKGKSPASTSVKVAIKFKKPRTGEAFTARPGVIQISVKNQSLTTLKLKGIPTLNTTTLTTGDTGLFDTCIVLTNHQAYQKVDTSGRYKAKVGKTGAFKF